MRSSKGPNFEIVLLLFLFLSSRVDWYIPLQRQVNECLEILRLGATNVHDQAKYKAYRLSIKRRIYMQQIGSNNRKGVEKEDEEDEENEEKIKQGLHDLYLETEALYRKVLDALDKWNQQT